MRTPYGRFVLAAFILVGLLTVFPALAQDVDLDKTFTFDDGTTFQYPSDWTLEAEDDSYVTVYGEQTQIFVVEAVAFEDAGFTADDSLEDALETYFDSIYEDELKFNARKLESIEVEGREAVRYDYIDTYGDNALMIVVRFSDDSFGLLDSASLDGELSEEDVVLAVAASFDRTGEAADSGDRTVSSDTTPCIVSTQVADTVTVHVGPGTNRATIVFLPANEEFAVLGQAEADDGSLWWKLDREEVAPNKAAAEAWVAQLDVNADGGCDAVVDVNTPPVIPIVSAPPASGGGDTGGGTSGGGQPAGAGEAIPQSGAWTFTYPKTVPGSCTNIPTQNLQIDIAPDRANVSNANGSSLILDGGVFNRISPNTYQGSYINFEGDPVLLTLRVASPTYMTGEFIVSFVQDGNQCSVTITASITHN
jgi:hypothetical protein